MALENALPLDYLAIGHLACDLTPNGNQLGGTVSYAALTADALKQRAGILTATGEDVPLTPIDHLPRAGINVRQSTTFENRYTPSGRVQTLHHHAPLLRPDMIPPAWRETPLVHFGPIVHEIDSALLDGFPHAFIGLTPQGWLRLWDDAGRVTACEWPAYATVLAKAHAVVLSVEDVGKNETRLAEMAEVCPILVATEGASGARLFIRGVPTHIPTLPITEIDATGAGDIFAAAFFIHLRYTGDPFQAAHFATRLGAQSVTRPGLTGIPTPEEIHTYETSELLQPIFGRIPSF